MALRCPRPEGSKGRDSLPCDPWSPRMSMSPHPTKAQLGGLQPHITLRKDSATQVLAWEVC